MKVYLVKEHWDNCDEYDLYLEEEPIIGVAVNRDLANGVIEKRKKYLIDLFNKSRSNNDYDSFEEVNEENTLPGYDCGLIFDTETSIFGHDLSRGQDAFYWTIEEHDLIES